MLQNASPPLLCFEQEFESDSKAEITGIGKPFCELVLDVEILPKHSAEEDAGCRLAIDKSLAEPWSCLTAQIFGANSDNCALIKIFENTAVPANRAVKLVGFHKFKNWMSNNCELFCAENVRRRKLKIGLVVVEVVCAGKNAVERVALLIFCQIDCGADC